MVGKMCKFIPSKGKLFDNVKFEEYYVKQKNLRKIIFQIYLRFKNFLW